MEIALLGSIAGILTSGACLPQAYKVLRTRKTRDLSIITYTMLMVGCILWVIYSLDIDSKPLMYTNLFSLMSLAPIWIIMVINRIKH